MKRIVAIIILTVALSPAVTQADEPVDREKARDIALRALVDELERGKLGLKLEDLERPYFIEYALTDSTSGSVTAELGAVTGKNTSRSRQLRSDVRVGSYELDNTNFSGDYGGYYFGGRGGMGGAGAIPIENDYNAIRQGIWWATDRQYKAVVESFEKKKAFMESKVIEDKPNDFSRESPIVYFEDRIDMFVDVDRLEETAVTLSRIFREFPDIKRSSVSMSASGANKYLVNTEGARLRTAGRTRSVSVSASIQAEDGMQLVDSFSVHVHRPDDLPSVEDLAQKCRDMIKRLIAVKNAPKLETYTGPVLFEARAAATLFSNRFARQFAGGQRPVGSRTAPDDFANKLNKRILPRFIDVVDDPTAERIAGVPVMGHYKYDDQGVPARPVTLVEDGRLKTLLMSRNPSKEVSKSTGHGRGSYRPHTSLGCMVVTADPASDTAVLRQKLLEACQDEDLEYGIRIASLGGTGGGGGYWGYGGGYAFEFGRYARYGGSGTTPLVMYKVYPDGREELVRGAEIARIGLKAFKRVLGAGDTPYVLNTGGLAGGTVVVPALLFEELDLAKIDRDFDKPPILPTPLARGSAD